jgi:hypothetical protein
MVPLVRLIKNDKKGFFFLAIPTLPQVNHPPPPPCSPAQHRRRAPLPTSAATNLGLALPLPALRRLAATASTTMQISRHWPPAESVEAEQHHLAMALGSLDCLHGVDRVTG